MGGKMSKEYYQEYDRTHKEQRAEQKRIYYQKNKKFLDEYRRKYAEENRDKERQWMKNWISNNPEKRRINGIVQAHNRRRAGKISVGTILEAYRRNVEKNGSLVCCLCGNGIVRGEESLEHLTPICRGGTHDIENLDISHLRCNQMKQRKTLEEYRRT